MSRVELTRASDKIALIRHVDTVMGVVTQPLARYTCTIVGAKEVSGGRTLVVVTVFVVHRRHCHWSFNKKYTFIYRVMNQNKITVSMRLMDAWHRIDTRSVFGKLYTFYMHKLLYVIGHLRCKRHTRRIMNNVMQKCEHCRPTEL